MQLLRCMSSCSSWRRRHGGPDPAPTTMGGCVLNPHFSRQSDDRYRSYSSSTNSKISWSRCMNIVLQFPNPWIGGGLYGWTFVLLPFLLTLSLFSILCRKFGREKERKKTQKEKRKKEEKKTCAISMSSDDRVKRRTDHGESDSPPPAGNTGSHRYGARLKLSPT